MISRKFVLPLTLLMPAFAYADACEHFSTSYDRTYCTAKLFVESDKELNETYKELKKHLKGSIAQSLVQTQRNWLKYRNSSCENQGTINVACNYEVNKQRTEYLRDRLRECKTGNCQPNEILKENW